MQVPYTSGELYLNVDEAGKPTLKCSIFEGVAVDVNFAYLSRKTIGSYSGPVHVCWWEDKVQYIIPNNYNDLYAEIIFLEDREIGEETQQFMKQLMSSGNVNVVDVHP